MATLKETITFKNNVDRIIALIASAYENDKTVFVMGEKKAAKLLTELEKSKSCELDSFLFAIGIPNIGKKNSKRSDGTLWFS